MFPSRKPLWVFLSLLAAALVLAACSLQSNTAAPNDNQGAIQTSAAETVSAQLNQGQNGINATSTAIAATVIAQIQLTQAAAGTQVIVPSATQAPVQPTATLALPTPVPPTNTPVPPTPVSATATQVQIACDQALFVDDVNYPDGSDVAPGTSFVKTWRLKNNGSCTWNSS